jgi:hypothetical protein
VGVITPGADCDIYGSDITYSHCNFAHAPVAAFANHMGEVLTFRDCRFKAGLDQGLLSLFLPILLYMENTYKRNQF